MNLSNFDTFFVLQGCNLFLGHRRTELQKREKEKISHGGLEGENLTKGKRERDNEEGEGPAKGKEFKGEVTPGKDERNTKSLSNQQEREREGKEKNKVKRKRER